MSGARFLAVVGMGDGLVLMCVKSPNIYHHLPVVHPVDSLQGNHEVASGLVVYPRIVYTDVDNVWC
jgi:hypothetical protein